MARKKIRYRSVSDMCNRVTESLGTLPQDLDMVVGIPRSGLIAATLITLYRNLPMTDLDGLFEGRMIKSGRRSIEQINSEGRKCKALVVDDSVGAGTQIRAARERLKSLEDRFEFVFAAVYVSEEGASLVDLPMEVCPQPRCFQWNVMNHYLMQRACVDVLALLRSDVAGEAVRQSRFPDLFEQTPFFKPKYKLGSLVVPAEPSQREQVESWMDSHGLSCEHLVLAGKSWQMYAKARRVAQRERSVRMAFVFERNEARRSAEAAGVPVFSSQSFELCQPSAFACARYRSRRIPYGLKRRLGILSGQESMPGGATEITPPVNTD